jgi:hypothetical protein
LKWHSIQLGGSDAELDNPGVLSHRPRVSHGCALDNRSDVDLEHAGSIGVLSPTLDGSSIAAVVALAIFWVVVFGVRLLPRQRR